MTTAIVTDHATGAMIQYQQTAFLDVAQAETMPVDRNPALVYLASLADGSKRTMREALDTIANMIMTGATHDAFPWQSLRYQHTQAIQARLVDAHAPTTAKKMISALKGTLKECWRLGLMDAESYQRAVDLKSIKVQKVDAAERGRHITSGEIIALVNACLDGSSAGIRDAALLAVAYTGGLRRNELSALTVADYNPTEGMITVTGGKGGKDRTVYLPDSALDALGDWLQVRGVTPGALFTRIRKGGNLSLDGMTEQAIYDIMRTRADQAGVTNFTPHDLRRTYAGDMLDHGADLSTVQKLMGHSSPQTTAQYDRRGARAKKAAASKLHFPYKRSE